MTHSVEIAERLLEIVKLITANDGYDSEGHLMHIKLAESFYNMGAGCIFDDFKSKEQEEGGLMILDWIIKDLKFTKTDQKVETQEI